MMILTVCESLELMQGKATRDCTVVMERRDSLTRVEDCGIARVRDSEIPVGFYPELSDPMPCSCESSQDCKECRLRSSNTAVCSERIACGVTLFSSSCVFSSSHEWSRYIVSNAYHSLPDSCSIGSSHLRANVTPGHNRMAVIVPALRNADIEVQCASSV